MVSPIAGTGVVPSSGAIFNELTAVTRRAFAPWLTVQLYFSTPTLFVMMNAAQKAAGGINQVTFPVQGASMVQGQWTGYSGLFNKPQIIPGIQNAQFNLSYFTVPVPLVLGESLLQATEAVVRILDARMNDVYAVSVQQFSSALFSYNGANPLMPNSFIDGFDNGSNYASYGGINRNAAGNSFWQGQYYNASGQAVLTRKVQSQYLIRITDAAGGEQPDFVVMSPGDFAALQNDFIGVEQNNVFPGRNFDADTTIRSGFPCLIINNVPYFMDHWCPTGTIFYVNTKYTGFYVSEDAAWDFSGFYSLIPVGQLGQVGVVLTGYQALTAKPVANAIVTNFTGAAF